MDDFGKCEGRPLWRCLDGRPVTRTGAFPFMCPKCGASGLAGRPREVCGLPVALDGSDGAWLEFTAAPTAERSAWPWDVDIDTSRAALERCMRAIVVTESVMTCSFRVRRGEKLGRNVTAFTRIQIPAGRDSEFREICQPFGMRPPSRVQVGCEPVADDGHPGRAQ